MSSSTLKTPRRRVSSNGRKRGQDAPRPKTPGLSLRDLGWTREQAKAVRAKLSSFAEDWDDPRMDVYDAT